MSKQDNFDLLKKVAAASDLDVSRETLERFEIYRTLLQEWNTKINLTTITDDYEIYLKHFADSITVFSLPEINTCRTVIDVGTGAGFPGLPMKIMKPELSMTLLDPLNKRLNFIKDVAEKAGLSNVHYIHGRAEDVSRETMHRDVYDLAVSRAVSSMPIAAEYCLPFVKPHGYFVALKGPGIKEELSKDPGIFKKINAELVRIEQAAGLDDYNHNLVLVRKTGPTPPKYPRKLAQIKKDIDRYKDHII